VRIFNVVQIVRIYYGSKYASSCAGHMRRRKVTQKWDTECLVSRHSGVPDRDTRPRNGTHMRRRAHRTGTPECTIKRNEQGIMLR